MSAFSNIDSFSGLMLYIGVFGFIILVILMILSLLQKESQTLRGILAGLIIFIILLALLEGPGIIYAKFRRPLEKEKPVEVAEIVEQPPAPSPAPAPAETIETKPPEQPAPAPTPAPAPVPIPSKPEPTPAPRPGPTIVPEQPKPQPTPAPKPVEPAPPQPQPKPIPAPAPAPAPKETPAPRTAPSGAHRMKILPNPGGTGTIEIEIRGPILEVAKEHQPSAHLMIVLDGRYALVILPTRYTEQKKENQFGETVLTSVTYFWEKIYAGFDNVPYGPHAVLIDVSLEGPETHKSKMVGSGNLENDWNGFVQVPDGGSAQLGFGTKNWMTQELERIR